MTRGETSRETSPVFEVSLVSGGPTAARAHVDENDCLLPAQIARLDGVALMEANRKIECALNEESDAATFRLKARTPLRLPG